jgi:hypothetical protein
VVCLAAKPVVDGLEREFRGKAVIIRANMMSSAGGALARRYGIDVVPSFIVFDAEGHIVFKRNGSAGVPLKELRRALSA